MISTQDVRDRAAEWQLRQEIVEKDYVLGWLLAAIGPHEATGRHWIFKEHAPLLVETGGSRRAAS
jgi:hypothetical protein